MKNLVYVFKIFSFLVLGLIQAKAQYLDKVSQNLKQHVYYLASDKLQGRLTGTKYEHMAGAYIAKQFKSIGLKPNGDKGGWYEAFTFHTAYGLGKSNEMSYSDVKLKVNKDFYPLVFSMNGKAEGTLEQVLLKEKNFEVDIPKDASKDKYKGKVLLIDLKSTTTDPHSTVRAWRVVMEQLKPYNPAALVFYHSPDSITVDAYRRFNNLQQENIMMVHVTEAVAQSMLKISKNARISIQVDLTHKELEGHNVLGYLDRGKPYTIIIGAHYDHLGHDEYGNSLYRGKPEIHNGADDNASGTATLIELARLIKNNPAYGNYNYLFMAFSGEELGLLGSNYFTKHPVLPMKDVQCMINMDMVGRLDTNKREVGIYGTGTSPVWDSLLALKQLYNIAKNINIKGSEGYKAQNLVDNTSKIDTFHIKKSPAGMGASDHSSFYLTDVPCLHFFTGFHKDYHKPSDDADKINYVGMAQVTLYIYNLTGVVDGMPRLGFRKTKEESNSTPNFKVTLGIIPDYFYEGGGIRIDGISAGKTAEKAGLKKGDVIQKMGNYEVKDMQGYMETLSRFNKGEETEVKIKRDNQDMTVKVKF